MSRIIYLENNNNWTYTCLCRSSEVYFFDSKAPHTGCFYMFLINLVNQKKKNLTKVEDQVKGMIT